MVSLAFNPKIAAFALFAAGTFFPPLVPVFGRPPPPPPGWAPSQKPPGFEITDRGVLPFGVPFVRSGQEYGNNRPTALDIGPRGVPKDHAGSGMAWIDVCNADLIEAPKRPVTCLFGGAYSDHMELGTRSFNSAVVQPLKLRIGNTVVGELNSEGLEIYGRVSAAEFSKQGASQTAPAINRSQP